MHANNSDNTSKILVTVSTSGAYMYLEGMVALLLEGMVVLLLCGEGRTSCYWGGSMDTCHACAPVPTPPSASPLHDPDQWDRYTSSLERCHSSQRTAPQSPQHLQPNPASLKRRRHQLMHGGSMVPCCHARLAVANYNKAAVQLSEGS